MFYAVNNGIYKHSLVCFSNMSISKKLAVGMVVTVLTVGAMAGFWIGRDSKEVRAEKGTSVDGETLDELYDAVFHRPADAGGRGFHLGRDLKDVLRDFRNSQEMRYYGALFKAVKSYEEAQRAPGTLSDAEKQSYLDLIDSALSNLLAWVATLPDQDACRATVGAVEAREAIQRAYDGMSPVAKAAAEKGIFNALKQLGKPNMLAVHPKCLRTPTPVASPTVSPIVSPSVTPTPTPSPTPSPTPTPTPTV